MEEQAQMGYARGVEVLRRVARILLRPSLVGALYMLAQAVRAALTGGEEDPSLGHRSREIHDFIYGQFGHEITRISVAVAAVALVIGAGLGALAGLLVMLRDRVAERKEERPPLRLAAHVLGITAVLHLLVMLHAMAKNPQLYAGAWYARGGVWRAGELLATDVLGGGGVVLLGILAAGAYVAGPPSRWKTYPARVGALVQGQGKTVASVGAATGAVLLLALAARAPAPARAEGPKASAASRPNVIIIAADSLRNDRVTPKIAKSLAALGEKGTRFDRAYVSFPRTFPSWISILTGRHAHHHGIRSMFPRWDERAKDFDALPERLATAGYATSVVSDYAGDIFGRVDLGFQDVDVPAFDFKQLVRQRALERQTPLLPFLHSRIGRAFFPVLRELNDAADPDMLTDDAVRAIDRMEGKPFFLTVFYSTAHFPYAAPAPYYRRFTDPSYGGRFKYHKPVGLAHEASPDDKDVKQVQGLYDGAVAAIDDAAAKLLDAVQSRGLGDRTIVVVTADHGETLYDHDHGQGHGDHLFGDEGTHVPLIIVDPRHKTARHEASIVRDVDLAPTLYELTGVAPPQDLDGRSLVPALDGPSGKGALSPALAYAETGLWFTEEIPALPAALRLPYPGITGLTEIDPAHGDEVVLQKGVRPLTIVAKHRMVRDDRWKLVYAPTRSGPRYMLYDTQSDPAESKEVSAENPDVLKAMQKELWAWMLRDPDMVERGGYLVPRDVRSLGAEGDAAGLRLSDLPKPAEPLDSSQAAPPPAGAQP
jgi:arylsulfatase A-like enzyme